MARLRRLFFRDDRSKLASVTHTLRPRNYGALVMQPEAFVNISPASCFLSSTDQRGQRARFAQRPW